MLRKIAYALGHPEYLFTRLANPVLEATNYDHQQWARVVMYETLFKAVTDLGPAHLEAMEISPGGPNSPWRALGFKDYVGVDFPNFDICGERLDRQFDLIIADQVFEHLLWPYRAAKNVFAMLKPDGYFINTTPFLIKVHNVPVDCTRWTELGMKHLLAEAGFDLAQIQTGAWGNSDCVIANVKSRTWPVLGWGRNMKNEVDFPVAVWAIARK